MKFGFKRPIVFLRKISFKMFNLSDLDKGESMTLCCHKSSCTHSFDCMYTYIRRLQSTAKQFPI